VLLAASLPRRGTGDDTGFARVELTDAATPVLAAPIIAAVSPADQIESTLPDGARIRVDATMDERASRRVRMVPRER